MRSQHSPGPTEPGSLRSPSAAMATVSLLLAQSEIVGLSALLDNAPQHADADQASREQGKGSRDGESNGVG